MWQTIFSDQYGLCWRITELNTHQQIIICQLFFINKQHATTLFSYSIVSNYLEAARLSFHLYTYLIINRKFVRLERRGGILQLSPAGGRGGTLQLSPGPGRFFCPRWDAAPAWPGGPHTNVYVRIKCMLFLLLLYVMCIKIK